MKPLTIAFFIALACIFHTPLLNAQCPQSNTYGDYLIITPTVLGITDVGAARNFSNIDISSQLGYPAGSITVALNNANNENSGSFYISNTPSSSTTWTFGGSLNPYVWVRHGNNLSSNSKDGVISFDNHLYTFIKPDGTSSLPSGFSSGSEPTPRGWGKGTLYRVLNSNADAGRAGMYWRSNGVDGGSGIRIYTSNRGNSVYSVAIQKNTCNLPVIFDKLRASFTNEKLDISWSTLQETCNSHFDIMASANGVAFKKIGTVNSKSSDGNSNIPLNYNYSINTTQAFALLGALALSLLIPGFARNNKKLSAVSFFAISLLLFYSCQKNDRKITIPTGSAVYLKIVQIDKDGSFKESKTIKAIKKN